MNDIDMENHPTKSKQKKNEGQRKIRFLATKSSQGPLLQGDKYGHETCFFCVKASVVWPKESASLHIPEISKYTISPFCIPHTITKSSPSKYCAFYYLKKMQWKSTKQAVNHQQQSDSIFSHL